MNVFDLIIKNKEQVALDDVFLDEVNRQKFEQLFKEQQYIEELSQYGLPVNNKILLHGSSGCGKTMTAKAIAQALGKNILILNLSKRRRRNAKISKYLDTVNRLLPRKSPFVMCYQSSRNYRYNFVKAVSVTDKFLNALNRNLDEYYTKILSRFPSELQNIERKYNISFAEAKDHTFTFVKSVLVKDLEEKQKNTVV